MVKKDKLHKKCSITEEDSATILQRYPATTILALLQELGHSPDVKINWNQMVAKTSTGISNAREYQMLWRHLAYGVPLLEKFEDGLQPLDDDSDLEYELEASPAVSIEASTEAAACVKVLMSSGLPSDSSHPNGATIEAPLTINIPNGQLFRTHENSQPTWSIQGKNITVPVSVQKQPLPTTTSAEGGDANVLANNNMAPTKKRKRWSETEDLELVSFVQKYGEGNWSIILKAGYKGDRTANQLSQRWTNIKKRNQALISKSNLSGNLSEAQLAARHSLSVALNMPNLTAKTIGIAGTKAAHSRFAGTKATGNPVLTTAAKAEPKSQESQKGLNPTKTDQMGLSGSTKKSQVNSANTLPKLNSNQDDRVRAIAVAAGARIASPSDAASLLKAAQAKNAVHIMPTGCSSIQSSLPGSISTHSEPISKITAGLAATPLSTPLQTAVTPSAAHPGSSKVLPQKSQHTPRTDTLLSKQVAVVSCSLDAEPGCASTELFKEGAVMSLNKHDQVQEDKVDLPDQKDDLNNLLTNASNPVGSLNIERGSTDNDAAGVEAVEERQSAKGDPSGANSCDNQGRSEKPTDLPNIVTDGCNVKPIVSK